MKITRYNYGSLLPSEDEIIAQGRNFGEHERSCNEVANILFPEIESLQAKLNETEFSKNRLLGALKHLHKNGNLSDYHEKIVLGLINEAEQINRIGQ